MSLMTNNIEFKFDSWNETYRKPFGAICKDESIRFYVETKGVSEVHIIIHKDFEENYHFSMNKVEGGFELTLDFDVTKLHFYHFQIVGDDGKFYTYGNTQQAYGGLGELGSTIDYQVTVTKQIDNAPSWYQEGQAYHIFLDRFCASGKAYQNLKPNSFIYATKNDLPMYIKEQNGDIARWDFYGGDLWGVIDKLDYLSDMGITILYLSPLFTSRSNHRYDTLDYLEIDPMLGGEKAFTTLLKECNKKGMRIILDGVFNHCGSDSIYFDYFNKYGEGAYHNIDSPYRDWFIFHEDNTYESWWGINDLPKFNSQNRDFRNFILEAIKKWSAYGIGGWRLDVADELDDNFIHEIRECLSEDQVLLGEVWEDPTNKISYDKRRSYVDGEHMHGVMNYPFRDGIIDLLRQDITLETFQKQLLHIKENYPNYLLLNNLNNIGTHDTKRIMTMLNGDELLVQLALTIMMTLPGVPCVYYGDEIGLPGEKDPDNRRFFTWENVGTPLQVYASDTQKLRRQFPTFVRGDLNFIDHENVLIIVREDATSKLISVFNINDTDQFVELDEYGYSETLLAKSHTIIEIVK